MVGSNKNTNIKDRKNKLLPRSSHYPTASYKFLDGALDYISIIDALKSNILTPEDWVMINRVIIGCTEHAIRIDPDEYKIIATKKNKFPLSHLTFGWYYNYLIKQQMKNNDGTHIFRPDNIMDALPQDIKEIQRGDLSRLSKRFREDGIIAELDKKDRRIKEKEKRRRGTSKGIYKTAGPKSYYEPTEYVNALERVISKPLAKWMIFAFLFESRILFHLLYSANLELLYLTKFSTKNAIRTLYNVSNSIQQESDLEKWYTQVQNTNESEFKRLAFERAMDEIEHLQAGDSRFEHMIKFGGMIYKTPVRHGL